MRSDRIALSTAANGFAWLTTGSFVRYLWLALLLRTRHGFRREESSVVGPGETVFRDFVRGPLRLLAGHDDTIGYHLLADDAATSEFIRGRLAWAVKRA